MIPREAHLHQQRGNAVLLTLMGLMLLGLAGMAALHRQLDEAVRLTGETRGSLLAWNQAASALAWAGTVNWPPAGEGWQCQSFPPADLRGCMKAASRPGGVLLRGEGIRADSTPLFLYQLAAAGHEGGSGQPVPLAGGRLDFCPEKTPQACDGEPLP
ncbi:MAG: YgdB family protein [Yersiniaceae bacterium]|nr:YgdB family protein [Yersiniaceae bacterium]